MNRTVTEQDQRQLSAAIAEPLESRRLLSSSPARLLATLPNTVSNSGIDLDAAIEAGGRLYFDGHKNFDPEHLYASDGSNATVELMASNSYQGIDGLSSYHNQFFFFASTSAGTGLFISNGTVAGTVAVKMFNPSAGVPIATFVLNDKMYFLQNTGSAVALWQSDGTTSGTTIITAISAPGGYDFVSQPINGNVFFTLYTQHQQLWRTDGTATGTVLVSDDLGNDTINNVVASSTHLMFIRQTFNNQRTIYTANLDGTNLNVFTGAIGSEEDLIALNGLVYYTDNSAIYATDGTTQGTTVVESPAGFTSDLQRIGSRLAFIVGRNGPLALWGSDGTPQNASPLITNISINSVDGGIVPVLDKGFVELASSAGFSMYETDATAAGTRVLRYLGPGQLGKTPRYFGSFQNRVLMEEQTYTTGLPEIWSLDQNVTTFSITGNSYFDNNRNSMFDAGDARISGQLHLTLTDGTSGASFFDYPYDGFSSYLLDGFAATQYSLTFVPDVSATRFSTPATNAYNLNVTTSQTQNLDFISTANFVKGLVYQDTNKNGVQDANEFGVSGQVLFLDYNGNGYQDASEPSATTDVNGNYSIQDYSPGTYQIFKKESSGYIQTSPPGRTGRTITVNPAISINQVDPFGVAVVANGAITGVIWNDWNHDGMVNGADVQLPSQQVFVDFNDDGVLNGPDISATTASNGRYTFSSRVPGTYTIRLVLQSGQTLSSGSLGQSITVPIGTTATASDFLVYKSSATPPTGMISGRVFADGNANRVMDSGELPAWNATVWIDADSDGVFDPEERRAYTDNNGNYSFPDSAAGSYSLRVVLPSGAVKTTPTSTPTQVSLSTGQQANASDFGVNFNDTTPPTVLAAGLRTIGGPLAVQFRLSENVAGTLDGGDVQVTTSDGNNTPITVTGASFDNATNSAVFGLPLNLPDGNYHAVLAAHSVSDVSGNQLAAASPVDFFVLRGDANQDRVVNALDFSALASNFGSSTSAFGQGDFNQDGKVDTADFTLLASRFNTQLAAPTGATSVAALRTDTATAYLFGTDPIPDRSSKDVLL